MFPSPTELTNTDTNSHNYMVSELKAIRYVNEHKKEILERIIHEVATIFFVDESESDLDHILQLILK